MNMRRRKKKKKCDHLDRLDDVVSDEVEARVTDPVLHVLLSIFRRSSTVHHGTAQHSTQHTAPRDVKAERHAYNQGNNFDKSHIYRHIQYLATVRDVHTKLGHETHCREHNCTVVVYSI